MVARRADALKSVADACVAAHKESGVTQGGKFATIQADVADKEQVASILDKIPSDLRAVDVLGISLIKSPSFCLISSLVSEQCWASVISPGLISTTY